MNNGNNAQCMAQARLAEIPKASQFIFNFMRTAKVPKSNVVAKNKDS